MDVFLAVWSNKSQLDPNLNLKTHLYAAARNRALNHLRNLKVERALSGGVASVLPRQRTPEDERRENEISAAVHLAVEALPEKTRIIFSMNRFDHLTYSEIAEIRGVSVKTVETQMGRALKSLRDQLAHLL